VALAACIDTDDVEPELATTEQPLVHSSATYDTPALANTWFAWGTFREHDLGVVPAGTTLRISTCAAQGGSANGNPYMRLMGVKPAGDLEQLSEQNTYCIYVWGSQMTFTTDVTQRLKLRMGCWANTTCTSRVAVQRVFDSNGRLRNVPAAFDAIPGRDPRTDRSGFWKNGFLGRTTEFHNQGLTRVRVGDGSYGNWLVMSRSEDARIYIVGFGSRSSALDASLGPNLVNGAPPGADVVYSSLALGHRAGGPAQGSHAGGLQSSGRFLYVPVEGEDGDYKYGDPGKSHVYIVDLIGGWNGPTLLRDQASVPVGVPRSYGGASAVGVAKVAPNSERPRDFLMVVGDKNSRDIDFYVQPADTYGFADITKPWQHRFYWQARFAGAGNYLDDSGEPFGTYQSLSLIAQTDGSIYLLGTATSNASWNDFGSNWDWGDLFRVDSSVYGPNRSSWCGKEFCLSKVQNKTFACKKDGTQYCSFHGAAGAYFVPGVAERIFVYAGEYYSSHAGWQTFMEW
jgi:hypothetical protein